MSAMMMAATKSVRVVLPDPRWRMSPLSQGPEARPT